ncbi:MAG: urea ABC transporter permease subunit UrtB [Bauldia sp.]|nr:urea ABC transporter permease subunit UrtB [Bauldia sp.]
MPDDEPAFSAEELEAFTDTALLSLIADLGAAAGDFAATTAAVNALAADGNPGAVPVLQALDAASLYVSDDGVVFRGERGGAGLRMFDPIGGDSLGEIATADATLIAVNNPVRRAIRTAMGSLTLLSPVRAMRIAAAAELLARPDPASLAMLDDAIAAETDAAVRTAMAEARAAILVRNTSADEAERLAAVEILVARGDQRGINALRPAAEGDPGPVADAAAAGIERIQSALRLWGIGQNVVYGISLGSVLLLAAIGLAITFGVMGVINMAHGEMVMIGAYTTFVVQEIIRTTPALAGLSDWSLAIAIPAAFLVSGAVGIGIERGIIRWLYGRPLETLLATFGLSLFLQQAVRTIFGPTNKLVGNPSWMSGSLEIGQLTITYSRLWIVVFAAIVFIALIVLLRRSAFGLQMRAVTQNRRMASAMGIRTPWVDAMTFGLGSGIAGMAGVALSQIDNVSPNLGTTYIVDSFMVVVFGGVGNLWGTLVGAMSLGIVNKMIEPYAGAVLGKIVVLVFIILFIQRRPRGLFALRGRAIEA